MIVKSLGYDKKGRLIEYKIEYPGEVNLEMKASGKVGFMEMNLNVAGLTNKRVIHIYKYDDNDRIVYEKAEYQKKDTNIKNSQTAWKV